MAVVAEYKFNNATVKILDDEIRDVSEEEMLRRIREAQRAAWRLWEAQQLRRQEGETPHQSAAPTASPEGEALKGGN